jgi:hypothetical protein
VAQHDFDPYELLDALRGGDDVDLIRQSVEMVLQTLIEAEVSWWSAISDGLCCRRERSVRRGRPLERLWE